MVLCKQKFNFEESDLCRQILQKGKIRRKCTQDKDFDSINLNTEKKVKEDQCKVKTSFLTNEHIYYHVNYLNKLLLIIIMLFF